VKIDALVEKFGAYEEIFMRHQNGKDGRNGKQKCEHGS
jgi:hypothetical protein